MLLNKSMPETPPATIEKHILIQVNKVGFKAFLNKFEKFNRQVSSGFEWIGLIALLLIVAVTCVDVVGSKVFLWPVPGSIDITGLAQIVAIAFAVAFTHIIGRHVRVEFFVDKLPGRAQGVINSFISILMLAFFVLIVWKSFVLGQTLQTGGHTSLSARIPLYPFAYLIALASIPVCLVFLAEFLRSLVQAVKK